MSNTVLTTSFNAGAYGSVTRTDGENIVSGVIASTSAPILMGYPVKLVLESGVNKYAAFVAADLPSVIVGICVRNFIGQIPFGSGPSPFAVGIQSLTEPLGVIIKGFFLMNCVSGTPLLGAAVYVNTTGVAGAVGTISTTASANFALLPNAVFANNGKDFNNAAEVRYNLF